MIEFDKIQYRRLANKIVTDIENILLDNGEDTIVTVKDIEKTTVLYLNNLMKNNVIHNYEQDSDGSFLIYPIKAMEYITISFTLRKENDEHGKTNFSELDL